MNHPYSEADIIKYLRNQMDGIELDSFEKEMKSNRALEQSVNENKEAIQAIDVSSAKLMKDRFKGIERRLFYKKWLTVLVIVVTALLVAFYMKNVLSSDKSELSKTLYAQHFEKYRSPTIIRNSENQNTEMSKAITAYRNDNFEDAFLNFNSLCGASNTEACFYACLSAIYNEGNAPQKAKIIMSQNEAYSSILLWNEALINLKNEDIRSAKSNLQKLIQNGNYKMVESQSILDELNNNDQ